MDVNQLPELLQGKLLLIDKPLTWTSFDVVNKLRYQIKRKYNIKKVKVGHAGTLDPLATGLLIICTGKFTKKLNELQGLTKEYTGTITLGGTTPSYDLETEIDQHFDTGKISKSLITQTAKSFIGRSLQTPPIYSAKRIDGEKAYIKARKGENVKMKEQEVVIDAFDITAIDGNNISFRIVCSKGTYIRSIAHDFGQRMNNGAHLSELRRTKIGNFDVEHSTTVEEFIETLDQLTD